MRVLVERDDGGAAEVMHCELARDAEAFAQSIECNAECVGVVRPGCENVGAVSVFAFVDLAHEGLGVGEIARREIFRDFVSDREGETFAEFGGEAKLTQLGVVVGRCDAACGSAANGEIGTQEQPEAHVRRCGCEQFLLLLLGGRDVARAQSWVFADEVG